MSFVIHEARLERCDPDSVRMIHRKLDFSSYQEMKSVFPYDPDTGKLRSIEAYRSADWVQTDPQCGYEIENGLLETARADYFVRRAREWMK